MNSFVDKNANIVYANGHTQGVFTTDKADSAGGNDIVCLIHSSKQNECDDKQRERAVKVALYKLIAGTVICMLFIVFLVIGGALANSLAVMTEAAHMISDFISFLLGVSAVWFSQRDPSNRLSFGYYRAEVLSSLISMFIIWVLTGVLVYLAVIRIRSGDYEIHVIPMLVVSALGMAVNIIMGLMLSNVFSCGADSTDPESKVADSVKRVKHTHLDIRAAFIHVVGDVIQSAGVLIASVIIYFKPEWKYVDPLCIFVFSVFVLITTVKVLRDTFFILMEAVPKNIDYQSVKRSLLDVKHVKSVHSLHIWALTLDVNALSAHLVVDSEARSESVLMLTQCLLRRQFPIHDISIQIERHADVIRNNCLVCKPF